MWSQPPNRWSGGDYRGGPGQAAAVPLGRGWRGQGAQQIAGGLDGSCLARLAARTALARHYCAGIGVGAPWTADRNPRTANGVLACSWMSCMALTPYWPIWIIE